MNEITFKIKKTLSTNRRTKPNKDALGFGKHFTDHMLICHYKNSQWQTPEILPYQNLSLDPASSVLHYGQALFEGMKAFYQKNNSIVLFRPEYNWKRFNLGAERLCMPSLSQNLFIDGIKELLRIDSEWVPKEPNSSLYIRPTMIGTEPFLGVRPSNEYIFFTLLSPVGSYYGGEAQQGVKIWVEEEFVRAAPGGLGATKAAANYANSLYATQLAKQKGFAQVLWLDSQHEFIEEVGTMNVFFVIQNKVITPELRGTILAGGVRDSVIQLLKEWKIPVEERPISFKELLAASENHTLSEVFGTGTAAVITAVDELHRKTGAPLLLPQKGMGHTAQKLYDTLTGIQRGTLPDPHHWIEKI